MANKKIEEIEEKHPTFTNMIKDMKNKDEVKRTLVIYLREKQGLEIQKARDGDLISFKKQKTELSKPYNETISALENMMKCIYKFGHTFEGELKKEFENNLLSYARQLAEVKEKKEEDEKLKALAEAIKEINQDYDPTIKLLGLKAEYVSYILKTRFEEDAPKVEI
jgi:hypothetical protein